MSQNDTRWNYMYKPDKANTFIDWPNLFYLRLVTFLYTANNKAIIKIHNSR